jgi:hypothetical protein
MCIIGGGVNKVAATKLFACPSRDKRRQLTVYSNRVDTPAENVMLLPVPNPASLVLETVHKKLFEECNASFIRLPSRTDTLSATNSMTKSATGVPQSYLPVKDHGSYQVVLAPTMEDLERVPPGFMSLSESVKAFLRRHYSGGQFGVLLCKLKVGAVEYEPFAYSHELLEPGKLFLPTRHFHPHAPDDYLTRDYAFMAAAGGLAGALATIRSPHVVSSEDDNTMANDWDHEIYTAETHVTVHNDTATMPKETNRVAWTELPVAYSCGKSVSLRKFTRFGYGPNEDLRFPLVESPSPSEGGFWTRLGLF